MPKKKVKKTIEEHISALATSVQKGFAEVHGKFEKVNERFDTVDERFDHIEGRLSNVEADLHIVKRTVEKIAKRQDTDGRILANHEKRIEELEVRA